MNDVINQCIEAFKENNNFDFVYVKDLKQFIKSHFDVKIEPKTLKKEVVDIANGLLNEETIFIFF